jgi:hypothetical protein
MELGPGDAFLGAEPLDCQTARLLAANTIAPNIVELRVGAPCHGVDSWNGTKRPASQATRPDKDGYLGRLQLDSKLASSPTHAKQATYAEETAFDRMERAGLIGCLKGTPGTPTDLSTNPKHLDGFGHG